MLFACSRMCEVKKSIKKIKQQLATIIKNALKSMNGHYHQMYLIYH